MLNRACEYLGNQKIFCLMTTLQDEEEDGASLQEMLKIILSAKRGQELICLLGENLARRNQTVRMEFVDFCGQSVSGECRENLKIKIRRWRLENTDEKSKWNIFWMALVLAHELGHALYFSKGYGRTDAALSFKNQFYAEVWNEAAARLWERDICAELAESYCIPLKDTLSDWAKRANGALFVRDSMGREFKNVVDFRMQEHFSSREDFVRAFFTKKHPLLGNGILRMVWPILMRVVRNFVKPSRSEDIFLKKLMDFRFREMHLALKYDESPLEKCFFYAEPQKGIIQIKDAEHEATIDKKGGWILTMHPIQNISDTVAQNPKQTTTLLKNHPGATNVK